jgi:hypothetical protein
VTTAPETPTNATDLAECALIGALLADPTRVRDLRDWLRPSDINHPKAAWDRNRVNAANTARSAHDSRGRRTWRCHTATSCRRTSMSAFFDRELRARSPSYVTCRKTR